MSCVTGRVASLLSDLNRPTRSRALSWGITSITSTPTHGTHGTNGNSQPEIHVEAPLFVLLWTWSSQHFHRRRSKIRMSRSFWGQWDEALYTPCVLPGFSFKKPVGAPQALMYSVVLTHFSQTQQRKQQSWRPCYLSSVDQGKPDQICSECNQVSGVGTWYFYIFLLPLQWYKWIRTDCESASGAFHTTGCNEKPCYEPFASCRDMTGCRSKALLWSMPGETCDPESADVPWLDATSSWGKIHRWMRKDGSLEDSTSWWQFMAIRPCANIKSKLSSPDVQVSRI